MTDHPAQVRLKALVDTLSTQSNSGTAHPMFVVQQRRRVYGFDPIYTDDFVWLQSDESVEVDAAEAAELEAAYNETSREPDNRTRTAYQDQWNFVTACLTRDAAERYIAANRHNLTDPRVYVESGYRNHEWIDLRADLAKWQSALDEQAEHLRAAATRMEQLEREAANIVDCGSLKCLFEDRAEKAEARVEQLEQERDELQARGDEFALRIATLTAALKLHGRHPSDCRFWHVGPNMTAGRCSCGLVDAYVLPAPPAAPAAPTCSVCGHARHASYSCEWRKMREDGCACEVDSRWAAPTTDEDETV